MASTYKAYLGEGLGPLGELLLPLKIPHPGKVKTRHQLDSLPFIRILVVPTNIIVLYSAVSLVDGMLLAHGF